MNKDKLIELIEAELIKADAAANDTDFDKHMYAIHTLTSLYIEATPSKVSKPSSPSTMYAQQPSVGSKVTTQGVTDEEIRLMGGKVSVSKSNDVSAPSHQRMKTDDEIGNGESIFDF
ncbi:DUF5327 family protein [Staphylococcus ratti]|uniref:YwdI family protein n=1 Tax=Staphylococcus ratti TaxID=2892440 RepID=A0ABY3PC81_9STAP|nr:DUF5327 family protein [Staphylococcus ratti]UEX89886.1 YwdI family protein [Staphylococcus ratti]